MIIYGTYIIINKPIIVYKYILSLIVIVSNELLITMIYYIIKKIIKTMYENIPKTQILNLELPDDITQIHQKTLVLQQV